MQYHFRNFTNLNTLRSWHVKCPKDFMSHSFWCEKNQIFNFTNPQSTAQGDVVFSKKVKNYLDQFNTVIWSLITSNPDNPYFEILSSNTNFL